MDNLQGFVCDIEKLEASGMKMEILNQTDPEELNNNYSDFKIIDVRSYTEYDAAHLPNAINIHTGYIEKHLNEIPADEKLVIYCASGDRSAIAASYLLRNGYKNVSNLSGGINSWVQSGYKIEKTIKEEIEITTG